MSHFSVAVFLKENSKEALRKALAPYQENNMEDCPKEFLEFIECSEEDINNYENHKDEYDTLDDYMYHYCGYRKDETTNKYGYWENPNAQWDWYEVGGRWGGLLIDKDGEKCDISQLKNIDWEAMRAINAKDAERIWDSNPQGIERYFADINEDDTRESYVARQSEFTTYAVIDENGDWFSKGKMGLFGISSETSEESKWWDLGFNEAFIKNANEDLYLVIVDCHI